MRQKFRIWRALWRLPYKKRSNYLSLICQGSWNLLWQKQRGTVPPLSLTTWDLSALYFVPGLQSSAAQRPLHPWCTVMKVEWHPSPPALCFLPTLPACLGAWHTAGTPPGPPSQNARRGPAVEFAAGGWNSSSSLLPACLSHSVVLWLLALLLWHAACLISLRPLFKVMASETIGLWDQMAFGCPADRAVH